MSKYTFFEAAAQHGQIVAMMAPRMQKSKDFYNIVIDKERGRVFRMFKTARPDEPYFEFIIPDREATESTRMWGEKARRALDKAWAQNEKERAQAKADRRASGPDTTGPSQSEYSRIRSLSTARDTKLESSSSQLEEAVAEAMASDLDKSILESSPIEPPSSKTSGRPSRKSGSKSRSSSMASTAKSG